MQESAPDNRKEALRQQSLRDLAALNRERDLFHGLLHGMFTRASSHFSAADTDPDDAIERWGRRIGRALAAVAFVAFCLYLYLTFLR